MTQVVSAFSPAGVDAPRIRRFDFPSAAAPGNADDCSWARLALDLTRDSVFLLSADSGKILDANASACRLLDYTRGELRLMQWRQVAVTDSRGPGEDSTGPLPPQGEGTLVRRDGGRLPMEVSLSVAADLGAVVAVVRDLRESRRLADLAASAPSRDPLTGLPNSALFKLRMAAAHERLQREGTPFALLFLDLDEFKRINDTWGHRMGDRVLTATARRLERCLRSGEFLARYGGDEFVVVMTEGVDPRQTAECAARIAAALQPPIALEKRRITVRASVGYVVASDPHRSLDSLIDAADEAMYRNKWMGRGGQWVRRVTRVLPRSLRRSLRKAR